MTVRPFEWYFPPVFLVSPCERVRIYLFDGDGVPRCSGDGIFFARRIWRVLLMGVPSTFSPVLVTLTPPSDASRTVVRLLTVLGLLPLVLSKLRFHVPSELSAPNIPIAVIATAII